MKNTNFLWIGLWEVSCDEKSDLLGGHRGAFVNVIGMAYSSNEYEKLARSTFSKMGFDVVGVEDIDIYDERMLNFDIDIDLQEIAESITDEKPIGIGVFDSFPYDERN